MPRLSRLRYRKQDLRIRAHSGRDSDAALYARPGVAAVTVRVASALGVHRAAAAASTDSDSEFESRATGVTVVVSRWPWAPASRSLNMLWLRSRDCVHPDHCRGTGSPA